MKRTIKISGLFLYILFTQVYPVVHWHAQEHQGDVELHLSVHPTELTLDTFDHDDHHDKSDEHEHEDIHFDADWEYILQTKTLHSPITVKAFQNFESLDIKPQVLSRIPKYIPLKVPSQYSPLSFPNRAPPFV